MVLLLVKNGREGKLGSQYIIAGMPGPVFAVTAGSHPGEDTPHLLPAQSIVTDNLRQFFNLTAPTPSTAFHHQYVPRRLQMNASKVAEN